DYGVPAQRQAEQTNGGTDSPSVPGEVDTGVPTADVKADLPQAASNMPHQDGTVSTQNIKVIKVVSDLLSLEISTLGGTVQRADLLNYRDTFETPDISVELFTTSG
ncbi:MAG: YidC/Oxa1 family insertase periplasmic-domain containing protein, partial [Candidatus Thiodiazotropha sp. 6PLUC3]